MKCSLHPACNPLEERQGRVCGEGIPPNLLKVAKGMKLLDQENPARNQDCQEDRDEVSHPGLLREKTSHHEIIKGRKLT